MAELVLHGYHDPWYVLLIRYVVTHSHHFAEVAIQVIIMFVGGAAFSVAPIVGCDWAISIVFGFLSIPVGAFIRTIPNDLIRKVLIRLQLMRDPNTLPTIDPATEKYNLAIEQVRGNLSTFANIRGGRSSSIVRVRKRRPTRLHEASVGAGWHPEQSAALHDPGNSDPSGSSADLWAGKLQLHTDTDHGDPAYQKWGRQLENAMTPGPDE